MSEPWELCWRKTMRIRTGAEKVPSNKGYASLRVSGAEAIRGLEAVEASHLFRRPHHCECTDLCIFSFVDLQQLFLPSRDSFAQWHSHWVNCTNMIRYRPWALFSSDRSVRSSVCMSCSRLSVAAKETMSVKAVRCVVRRAVWDMHLNTLSLWWTLGDIHAFSKAYSPSHVVLSFLISRLFL